MTFAFQICITIHEGTQLAGLNVDPVVKVQVGDEHKYSSIKQCTNTPYFNEVRWSTICPVLQAKIWIHSSDSSSLNYFDLVFLVIWLGILCVLRKWKMCKMWEYHFIYKVLHLAAMIIPMIFVFDNHRVIFSTSYLTPMRLLSCYLTRWSPLP